MSRKPSTMFGTMDSDTKFTSLICPPSFAGGSLTFQLGESYRPKSKVSYLQKFQTNKSQFADDAGQWAVSKNIDLAAEYLQRDFDKLARWCAKWRIKLNPEKTKVIIFSKSQTAVRAEPDLSLYGDLLSYCPHIKFLGITFDNRMTFTKHFEEILEHCNQKFHLLRYWSTKSGVQVPQPFYKSTNNV